MPLVAASVNVEDYSKCFIEIILLQFSFGFIKPPMENEQKYS